MQRLRKRVPPGARAAPECEPWRVAGPPAKSAAGGEARGCAMCGTGAERLLQVRLADDGGWWMVDGESGDAGEVRYSYESGVAVQVDGSREVQFGKHENLLDRETSKLPFADRGFLFISISLHRGIYQGLDPQLLHKKNQRFVRNHPPPLPAAGGLRCKIWLMRWQMLTRTARPPR